MRFRPAMLIVILGLILASCVPVAEPTAAEPEPLWTLPPDTEQWSASFFGVPVSYSIGDELLSKEGEVIEGAFFPVSFDADDGGCNLRSSTEILSPVRTRAEVVRVVIGVLTSCYTYNGDLTGLEINDNGFPVLADPSYPLIYLEVCGPLLQPLGWPTGDGACELPDIRQGFVAEASD